MKFIINIVGGPGIGKTTISALVFSILKIKHEKIEYVQEFAKSLVWRKDFESLNNQYLVSNEQHKIFKEVSQYVDFIITDGSLLHGLHYNRYNKDNTSDVLKTQNKILEWYNEFINLNIFLERNKDIEYQTYGRLQTKNEAEFIDTSLRTILDEFSVKYNIVIVDTDYEKTAKEIITIFEDFKQKINNFTQ
jgi:broad-specificity NMP kinase